MQRDKSCHSAVIGCQSLLYTDRSCFTEALPTVNFQDINQGHQLFDKVEALSEDFPLMVTEYWSGWFDHWGSEHHTQSLDGNILTWSDFKHKNRITCGMVNSL